MKQLETSRPLQEIAAEALPVTVLTPSGERDINRVISALQQAPEWPCFAEPALAFCRALGEQLLANTITRERPDIVALAFWLRNSQLQQMYNEFSGLHPSRVARGLIFQIAPGNVDTVFVYSLLLAFLLGNRTLVKVSSRTGASAELIIQAMNQLLAHPQHRACAERIAIIQYASQAAVTQRLSELAQLRVIWGGNQTIAAIQAITAEKAIEDVVFPNRHSAALINASTVNRDNIANVVDSFCKDSLVYAQQACSSPRCLLWLGKDKDITRAQQLFWPRFQQQAGLIAEAMDDADCFQREVFRQRVAVELGQQCAQVFTGCALRLITQAAVNKLMASHCGLQVFFELQLPILEALEERLDDDFQTLACFGVDPGEVEAALSNLGRDRLKRLVPLGQALTFSHHWDGINLLDRFSQQEGL